MLETIRASPDGCSLEEIVERIEFMAAVQKGLDQLDIGGLPLQVTGQTSPRFEDYEVAIYKGTIHRPKWIRRAADDEWRDELGKLVEPPEINFAGKYFVSV